jgi:hypothetical protein
LLPGDCEPESAELRAENRFFWLAEGQRAGYSGGVKVFWCLAMALLAMGCATVPDGRPMKLVVLGTPGTMFAAKYKVDGATQEEAGLMPATIQFGGRSVEWEVMRPSGDREFRVEFYVGELKRTSTTSSGKAMIRGGLKYTATSESYWAEVGR